MIFGESRVNKIWENSSADDGSLGTSNLRLLHNVLSSCLKDMEDPADELRHSSLNTSLKLSVDTAAAGLSFVSEDNTFRFVLNSRMIMSFSQGPLR